MVSKRLSKLWFHKGLTAHRCSFICAFFPPIAYFCAVSNAGFSTWVLSGSMSSRSSVNYDAHETEDEESDSAMLVNHHDQDPTTKNPFKDSYNFVYIVFLLCEYSFYCILPRLSYQLRTPACDIFRVFRSCSERSMP